MSGASSQNGKGALVSTPTKDDQQRVDTSQSKVVDAVNQFLINSNDQELLHIDKNSLNDPVLVNVLDHLLTQINSEHYHSSRSAEKSHLVALQQSQSVLEGKNAALQRRLDDAERELFQLRQKLAISQAGAKQLEKSVATLKDELRLCKQSLVNVKSTYAHELKKKETEYLKVKNLYQKTVTDGMKAQKFDVKVVDGLDAGTRHFGSQLQKDKSVIANEVAQQIIQSMESTKGELLEQINYLRQQLVLVFQLIQSILIEDQQSSDILKSVVKSYLQLPACVSKDNIQQAFEVAFEELKIRLTEYEKKVNVITQEGQLKNEQIQILQSQIEELKHLIDEQAQLLDTSLTKFGRSATKRSPMQSNPVADNVDSEQTKQMVETLNAQREQLERERVKFTEAALKLGKERERFELEKLEFEKASRQVVAQKVLTELPATPQWLKNYGNVHTQGRGQVPQQSSPITSSDQVGNLVSSPFNIHLSSITKQTMSSVSVLPMHGDAVTVNDNISKLNSFGMIQELAHLTVEEDQENQDN
ncbi:hypothetical protein MIR68_000052 [Amoeboaphelidium protococcarum]|nr:hypothetical protein MIR68_000052 [Amoeboaphelidium protococcarum]